MMNEPYDNTDGHWGVSKITGITVPRTKGQYTLKRSGYFKLRKRQGSIVAATFLCRLSSRRYHIKSKFPSVVVAMMPENAMFLIEECWNAYPHIRTVLVNAYFAVDKFHIVRSMPRF
jgi:hypothetical protein